MADCKGECQDVKYEKLEWFKIAEEGMLHMNADGTKNESSRICKFNFPLPYSKAGTNFEIKGQHISILARSGRRIQKPNSGLQ